MKLYYAPGVCSLATHIVLREIGADFAMERVDLPTKVTETGADFRAVNPKGYVPALVLDDGEVLTEGAIIMQYLADSAPDAKLAPPRGTRERRKLEELLIFISTELHKGHSPLFTPGMPEEAKTIARGRIALRYGHIEASLADGRAFLTGDGFTIADAYLFTVTNWAGNAGVDLSPFPNIRALAARIAARSSVQAVLEAEGLIAKAA